MNKIYDGLKKLTTGRNIWIFGLLALTLSTVMLVIRIPDGLAGLMGYSGQPGMFAPDAAAFSGPDKVYSILADYGDTGRKVYTFNSLLFDLAYPVSYALFLATAFTAVLGRLLPATSPWQKLSLIPLLGGLFDLLENISFYSLIANFPKRISWLETLASILTAAKGLITYGSVLVLLVCLVLMWLVKKPQPVNKPANLPVKH